MGLKTSTIILMILLTLSTVHLSIYTRNINTKYEVEGLKRELAKIKDNIRDLQATESLGMDLAKIERLAEKKLGMIRPEKIEYLLAPSDEVSP